MLMVMVMVMEMLMGMAVGDGDDYDGMMMKHDTEQPLRYKDLQVEPQESTHSFSQATGGLQSMTLEQCLGHPDISAWISDGRITKERVRELWIQVVASQNTEVLGFKVSDIFRKFC